MRKLNHFTIKYFPYSLFVYKWSKVGNLSEMLEALQFPDVEMLNHMNYKILSIIKALQTVKIVNDVMTRFTQLKNFIQLGK